jgi:endonuclease/exonuclease/phosphatase family metal-dependent hydrolase
MTYNILDGGIGRESYILDVLRAIQPDVIVLQEVLHADFAQTLGRALDMETFFAAGNTKRQLALLSRLPIIAKQSYHPFLIHRTVLEAEIKYTPNQRFAIFGIHTIALHHVIFELWRWGEVKTIVKRTRLRASIPCLILGDFNAIAPNDNVVVEAMPLFIRWMIFLSGQRVYRFAIRALLSAGFTDCFRALNPNDDGFTLPPPTPNARLDYIFANEVMQPHLRRCFVVREPAAVQKASDHYPVVAEFEL